MQQQRSVGRRRERSIELPGQPTASAEDDNQKECDQRAQGFSVEASSGFHKAAGSAGPLGRLLGSGRDPGTYDLHHVVAGEWS